MSIMTDDEKEIMRKLNNLLLGRKKVKVSPTDETQRVDDIQCQWSELTDEEKEIVRKLNNLLLERKDKSGKDEVFPTDETQKVDDIQCPWCGACFDGDSATNYDTSCSHVECPACGKSIGVIQSVEYTCRREEE